MRVLWVMPRWAGPPGRAGLPVAERRKRRRKTGSTMTRCCLVSFGRPSVGQPTGKGGRGLLPDNQCTKTGRLVAEVLQEKHPDMRVPPVENPTCTAFEEYGELPETVPLDFTEDEGGGLGVSSQITNAQKPGD